MNSLNFVDYKNNVAYPIKPKKPKLSSTCPTKVEMAEFSEQSNQYEIDIVKYNIEREIWCKKESELMEKFRHDALNDVGLLNHPNVDKIYNYAWQEGHSGGLSDVYYTLVDLADLFK